MQEVLKCRCGDYVVTAPGAPKIVEKGRYGASLLAHIAVAKCADHLPIYRLEKEGKLGNVPPGTPDRPVSPEARAFVEGQLLKGGQLLGALWLTAWKSYKADAYLIGLLQRRQRAQATPPPE